MRQHPRLLLRQPVLSAQCRHRPKPRPSPAIRRDSSAGCLACSADQLKPQLRSQLPAATGLRGGVVAMVADAVKAGANNAVAGAKAVTDAVVVAAKVAMDVVKVEETGLNKPRASGLRVTTVPPPWKAQRMRAQRRDRIVARAMAMANSVVNRVTGANATNAAIVPSAVNAMSVAITVVNVAHVKTITSALPVTAMAA